MKKNIGSADKIIRILAAIVIVVLYFTNMLSGTVEVILLIAAVIFVLTSLLSYCPLYPLLKISTCPKKE